MKRKAFIKWSIYLAIAWLAAGVNGKNLPSYKHLMPVKPITWNMEDGSLIFSNSPETIKEPGLLCEERFTGKGRLVYHHANGSSDDRLKLIVIMENQGETACVVTVASKGHQGPSKKYLQAGQEALCDFFLSRHYKSYVLQPGEKMKLYSSPETGWPVEAVLTGIIDLETDHELLVRFAAVPLKNAVDEEKLIPLDKSIEQRGKFNTLTVCQHVLLPIEGKFYYLIEDSKLDWQTGKDQITGENAINYGNYGIMYKITVYASERTDVFICPRGGIFQGIVRLEDGSVFSVQKPHVFKVKKEMIRIARLEKGECRTFEYMLPNGSAAPILVGFEINV